MDMLNPMDFSPVSYLDSIMNGTFISPGLYWSGINSLLLVHLFDFTQDTGFI